MTAPAISPNTLKRQQSFPANTKPETITRTFVLKNHPGLLCRPAALLIKTLEKFNSQVKVKANDTLVNGRSILGLMTLSAAYGTPITFIVSGPDAEQALDAIGYLFKNNFAEAYE